MEIRDLYNLFLQNHKVTTDTRSIREGSIFFALRGDSFDGNEFAEEALNKGASYCIIDNSEYNFSERTILVNSVLETLQELATYHRKQLNVPIISITGTNGKTTTKELMNAVLKRKYKTKATEGNLNNHIGVPLTLLSMNSDTEVGIVEMGANHIGEIDLLCKIAEPNFGIITNIGKAHLEGFGSFEGVKRAKTELFKYLEAHKGVIFFNIDNEILRQEIKNISIDTISYGEKSGIANCRLIDASPYLKCSIIESKTKNEVEIQTQLVGIYNLENVLAASAVGLYFGLGLKEIEEAISSYVPQNNRSQLKVVGTNTIFCDYYNANPTSMERSILDFEKGRSTGQKKVVMLGSMKELGKDSDAEHLKIIELVAKCSFDKVFYVGDEFCKLLNNYPLAFATSEELCNYIIKDIITDSYILIKGSRSVKMEKVMESLEL